MDIFTKIISNTAFVTVLSGVIVFIISQLFIELYIRPLARYNEIRAKIAYNLVYYANIYMNPFDLNTLKSMNEYPENYKKASEDLRKLAAEITGFAQERQLLKFYISAKRIEKVNKSLIGLSNSCNGRGNDHLSEMNATRVHEIRCYLHLKSMG